MRNAIAYLLLCSSMFLFTATHAQETRRYYRTQSVHQRLLTQIDDYELARADFQPLLDQYRNRGRFEQRTIPIIFHIVHQQAAERISEAQIQSQVDALNLAFSQDIRSIGHPAEAKEGFRQRQARDTYIRFCLADTSASVNYIASEVVSWTSDDAIKSSTSGGADVIAPDRYLNVWVGKFDTLHSGYAQLPLGPAATDGIAIDYRFFGTLGTAQYPFDEGKTLVHLVGNYLGLQDLWDENLPCGDDGLWDTPVHNAPNHGCPRYRHFSLCNDQPVEMSMNLMDNTHDACSYLFTWGQVLRMQAVLNVAGLREQLGKSTPTPCENGSLAENTPLEARTSVTKATPLLQIHPNPAQDYLHLQFEGASEAQLLLYRADGTLIQQQQLPQFYQAKLDCSHWQAGVYFVQVIGQDFFEQQAVVLIR
ncbi:MAG: M43 family zinc metalloprotease [Bacteroidota bacterium]